MKKIKIVFSLIIAFCVMISSVGCVGTPTARREFKGKLSLEIYHTKEEASQAFFTNQLSSNKEDCKYLSYSTKKELTKSDISSLELGEVEDLVIYGELGKVSFNHGKEAFTNDLYLLQTEEGYYYYTDKPDDGEAVTLDYYDFILDEEVMNNVHVKTSSMIILENEDFSRHIEVVFELYIEENEIKFEGEVKEFYSGAITNDIVNCYILKDGDKYGVFGVDKDGQYVDTSNTLKGFFDVDNYAYLVNRVGDIYLSGHHIFKKNEEKLVLKDKEIEDISLEFVDFYYDENGGEIDSFGYEVSLYNYKLSSISANLHSVDLDNETALYLSVTKEFSSYGDTKVEIPEEVYSLWEEIK